MSLYVALSIVCFVFGLVLVIPSFCLNVRRLHDVGRSGAWILVNFVPFGEFYFLYLICSEGQAIMNRYGRKTNYVGLTSEEAARIGKPASPTDTMIIVAFFVSVVCSIVAPCIWVAAGALATRW